MFVVYVINTRLVLDCFLSSTIKIQGNINNFAFNFDKMLLILQGINIISFINRRIKSSFSNCDVNIRHSSLVRSSESDSENSMELKRTVWV